MKTRIKSLFIIAFCIVTFVVRAQTVDEIVTKHIEAVGGVDNWSKVKSMRRETLTKIQGAEIRSTESVINRKAMRSDVSVMGMSGYTIITNTEGWSFSPWNGQSKAEAMTADDVKNAQDGIDILDKFITFKEYGKKLEYFDSDDIDGIECYKLKMTDTNGLETTFYIDPENYQIIKAAFKSVSNGREQEYAVFYSNYTKLPEGIVVPMIISGEYGGGAETTKIEINPVIDESIFKLTK